jgi:hypothetical protein
MAAYLQPAHNQGGGTVHAGGYDSLAGGFSTAFSEYLSLILS